MELAPKQRELGNGTTTIHELMAFPVSCREAPRETRDMNEFGLGFSVAAPREASRSPRPSARTSVVLLFLGLILGLMRRAPCYCEMTEQLAA